MLPLERLLTIGGYDFTKEISSLLKLIEFDELIRSMGLIDASGTEDDEILQFTEENTIRSVGDGIVLEAQYKSNNGNYVKVRHNATYTTQYLHMSKIASGIRPGARVRQGQTIGYVGSTGLANGPHLCYRFWKNGVQVDALKVELPPSQPIKEDSMGSFLQAAHKIAERLDGISFPETVEAEDVIASGR